MVRFSVIIPAYNSSGYIGKSIDSVKAQSFDDYELIIVDDCSNDDGKTVSEIKSHLYPKARLIEKETNTHSGGARNVGIENAKGEYIIFLDSDDVLKDSNVLEQISSLIDEKRYDMIFTGFDSDNHSISFIPAKDAKSIEYMIGKNKYINVCSICWRKDFISENKIKFRENVVYEDVYFAISGMINAESHLFSNIVSHVYTMTRITSNSSTGLNYKKNYKQALDTIKCIDDLSELYKQEKNASYREAILDRILEQKGHLSNRLGRGIEKLQSIYITKEI